MTEEDEKLEEAISLIQSCFCTDFEGDWFATGYLSEDTGEKRFDACLDESELQQRQQAARMVTQATRRSMKILPLLDRVDNIVELLETGQNSTAYHEALHIKEQLVAILAQGK